MPDSRGYSAGLKGRYAWDYGRHLELSYAFDQYDKANFMPDGSRTHDHDYTNRQHVAHALYHHTFGQNILIVGADYMNDYLSTYQFRDNASCATTTSRPRRRRHLPSVSPSSTSSRG